MYHLSCDCLTFQITSSFVVVVEVITLAFGAKFDSLNVFEK
jgi:hypothetical protein